MTINNLDVVAIIPARDNSKRVPGKNFKPLAGKLLVDYTIQAALDSLYIDKIVVTSNNLGHLYDLKSRFSGTSKPWCLISRPEYLAQDHVQVSEVTLHAFREAVQRGFMTENELIVSLAPTSPLRSATTIDMCIGQAYHNRGGTTFTVTESSGFYWGKEAQEWVPYGHNPLRRYGGQDHKQYFSPMYKENGAVYIVDAHKFGLETVLRFPPYLPVVVPEIESIDVDTPEDWEKAESVLRKKVKQ